MKALACIFFPRYLRNFKKQYPDVAVNIKRADYAKVLESVIDNSVDFGVVSMPITDNRLTAVLMHRDELCIIVPPRHPLAKLKSAPAPILLNILDPA